MNDALPSRRRPLPITSAAAAVAIIACASGCATTTTTGVTADDQRAEEGALSTTKPVWSSPEAFQRFCDERLAAARMGRERIKSTGAPGASGAAGPVARTIESTLEPLGDLYVALDEPGGWSSLVFNAHPDEAVRKVAQGCTQEIEKLRTQISMDREIYDAVAAVDLSRADAPTRRFAEHVLRDFRRSGVDKDDATRKRLGEIQAELVELSQGYGRKIREDVRSIAVADPRALAGLPEDFVATLDRDPEGRHRVSTDYPDFYPFETYSPDAGLRAELYDAFMARGYPDNAAVIHRILELRHEFATTLGYESWAAHYAEDKMAGSAATIDGFIEDLFGAVRAKSERELAELLARKRQDDPKAERIEAWDRFFYMAKVREAKFDFDARVMRPYFPVASVTRGVLALFGELFGVRFVPLPDEPVWHPSVTAYDMLQSGGELIGRLYLDLYPREGKYKHAAAFDVRTGLAGDALLPIGSLVCNFPDPSKGDGNALLEHSDVVTYFHEFGHIIHLLLGRRSPWVTLNGFNVEWDFVEAPSQLLEEWAWDPDVLARFARHVETGEPIPAELVRKARAAEEFGKGLNLMRQIFYTAYSFRVHATDPAGLDLEAFSEQLYERYSPYRRTPNDRIYANFEHLIGYSAGYYSYQWALAIAKDLLTRFKAEGLLNTATTLDYRRAILDAGAAEPAADLIRTFLGRPYDREAYKAWILEE